MKKEVRLSQLLKIGVKYFWPDQTSYWLFNDGTEMWGYYDGPIYCDEDDTNDGEYIFVCRRKGKPLDVFDDVHLGIPDMPLHSSSNWRVPIDALEQPKGKHK